MVNGGFDLGKKAGDEKRFYKVMIPLADAEFKAHLANIEKQGKHDGTHT